MFGSKEIKQVSKSKSKDLCVMVMSQGVRVIPWKVLGPGDDNSESINTLKVYCP